MKKASLLISSTVFIILIISGCSKKENNPSPVVKKKYAWMVGNTDSTGYGMIMFSPDGGITWERQGGGLASLEGTSISDVWAVDEDVVWVVGGGDKILRTENGGAGWIRISGPVNPAKPDLMSISVADRTHLWISGSAGTVYSSDDNGNTWTLHDTNFFHKGGMQGIWAITSQKVFVVGGIGRGKAERGFIGYTLDGGTTWDSVFPAGNYNRNEWIGVVASGETVVVYGGQSHYMVSFDGGVTWKNDSLDVAGGSMKADINHMIMIDPLTWWAAMDEGHIMLTGNGGDTWTDQSVAAAGGLYLVGIDAYDSDLALVVGQTNGFPPLGKILRTSDGGDLWNDVFTSGSEFYKISFIRE